MVVASSNALCTKESKSNFSNVAAAVPCPVDWDFEMKFVDRPPMLNKPFAKAISSYFYHLNNRSFYRRKRSSLLTLGRMWFLFCLFRSHIDLTCRLLTKTLLLLLTMTQTSLMLTKY